MSNSFERWLDVLRDDVIRGEYGHNEGEYTVSPDAWRRLYDKGLTPAQAFRSTLDAHARDRKCDETECLTVLACTGVEALLEARTYQTLH